MLLDQKLNKEQKELYIKYTLPATMLLAAEVDMENSIEKKKNSRIRKLRGVKGSIKQTDFEVLEHNDLLKLQHIHSNKTKAKRFTINYDVLDELDLHVDYEAEDSEVIHLLGTIDIRNILGIEIDYNKPFECNIIKDNTAWFSVDEQNNKIRYFSKNYKGSVVNSFDIFDLFFIIEGFSFLTTYRILIERLNLLFEEGEWRNLQNIKYFDNFIVLSDIQSIRKNYPTLYKAIKNYIPLLYQLISVGAESISKKEYSIDNDSIFYVSLKYLENRMGGAENGGFNYVKISRAISLFAALRLVEKVSNENLSDDFMEKVKKNSAFNGSLNTIGVFKIPFFSHATLQNANDIAEELIEKKVTLSNITKKSLEEAMGLKKAIEVFPNYRKFEPRKLEIVVDEFELTDVIPFA